MTKCKFHEDERNMLIYLVNKELHNASLCKSKLRPNSTVESIANTKSFYTNRFAQRECALLELSS